MLGKSVWMARKIRVVLCKRAREKTVKLMGKKNIDKATSLMAQERHEIALAGFRLTSYFGMGVLFVSVEV